MRALLIVLVAVPLLAKDKPSYPLTLKIVSVDVVTTEHQSGAVNTDCSTDPYTYDTHCRSKSVGPSSTSTMIQTAEVPGDQAHHVDVVCRTSIGARKGFLYGGLPGLAMAGMKSNSGCELAPGPYPARLVGASYRIQASDAKGKKKEIQLDVIRGPY